MSSEKDLTYTIDSTCISCKACLVEAKEFIAIDEETYYAYFYKEPISDEEIKMVQDAIDVCPVEAIHKK